MSKTLKIGIVVLIVAILFGINFMKNSPEPVAETNDLTNANIAMTYEQAKANDLPTMLEFRTETWPACKQMESVIEEATNSYGSKANIVVIKLENQDNYPLANEHSVRVVPTMVFLDKDENPISKIEGAMSIEEIEEQLKEAGM